MGYVKPSRRKNREKTLWMFAPFHILKIRLEIPAGLTFVPADPATPSVPPVEPGRKLWTEPIFVEISLATIIGLKGLDWGGFFEMGP